MKKIFILLFTFAAFCLAQQTIWHEDVQADAGASYDSDDIRLSLEQRPKETFGGLIKFELSVDSTLEDGTFADGTTPDSILYYPEWRIANKWVTGDTLDWYKVTGDAGFADTTTYVLPRTHHGWAMVSWLSPSNGDAVIDNIKELPAAVIRIKRVDNDSCNYYQYMNYVKK